MMRLGRLVFGRPLATTAAASRLPLSRPPFFASPALSRALCNGSSSGSSSLADALSPPPVLEAAATARPSRFAVISMGGSQYKVAADDLIVVEKLALPVGAELAARRVLLVGEAGSTVIGSPLIEGAAVHATVEEQGYGDKLVIFKKRRRKGYRRWRGYRARLTMLRINSIE